MASITYQQGGSARTITALHYQDGGSLRTITEAWYQEGGSLRKVWPAIAVALSNRTISALNIGGAASAQMQLLNTGVAQRVISPGGTLSFAPEWLSSGTPANYDARWTNTVGSITVGTAGTWQNLGTTRSYGVSRASLGTTTCTGTLEIRDAGTLAVLATATIDLVAEWA